MNYIIDEIDKKILMYLIDNTRIPFTEIAKKMNVSAGTIHVRVKKLEDAGIIKGSTLVINYEKMGYRFVAYVGILLTKTNKTQHVIDELYKIPNVTVVHVVSGKYNIFCKIRARDTSHAKEVIYRIDQIDDVLRTESTISLEESFNDKNRLLHSIFQ
ncbi:MULTISPECIES: Lrp/AsnC family transcriptional regulator [Weeksella]|uniref:Transcriptional regulator, AsnC family n=1 Tax=Weeksella virosa (strain ATCC 43766 / DSM 16922 / JCM 21250 / CCUG 30538 / CDC 9751 / IAM 14551 / NBRC 16016 / NCTC 11634 / CL345/78) TaxID=865938 RepID=F0NZZ6_WEEVC|nr:MULTISPECIES: winged helix-turn-helix transcriptional regulator [Weeksella]ADX68420.1 transcriptional regulator, AsnC family [Weeksella virosa DSM 16922]MDK7375525.1 winged helix-turn-helix transcriptional regulator [Weeksella virosa]MDK7674614.1 winged helix-turn-helix transcriptional regulator [Weeksella virosa]OFM84310.1 transcriptional regulator [Weeksella sp. HMSC059D05]SUP54752.1 Regulatory protein AsnC [Weeksella virosa]